MRATGAGDGHGVELRDTSAGLADAFIAEPCARDGIAATLERVLLSPPTTTG